MSKPFKLSVYALLCVSVLPAIAAKPVDLSHKNLSYLKSIMPKNTSLSTTAGAMGSNVQEISQDSDFNKTKHIRLKQMYAGYPVIGGDAVIHTPNGHNNKIRSLLTSSEATTSTMNGLIYENLQQDLQNTPNYVFSADQADKAFSKALSYFEDKVGARADVKSKSTALMVFVDKQNKAHWVFQVSASVTAKGKIAEPVYVLDAINFKMYKTWNNHKTSAADTVHGGGFGGNVRQQYTYDGSKGNLAGFEVQRDAETNICSLTNHQITVTDARTEKPAQFECALPNSEHNNVFWASNTDEINGGYSPSNDVMYQAKIIIDMYQDWYHLPVLSEDGKLMHLEMITHDPDEGENASWSDMEKKMHFGDGSDEWYPVTSLDVTAHEVSHGFTSQHSHLIYAGESGGMDEAFSDMAGQAAVFYSRGKADFTLGAEVVKKENSPLRYMDQPSKDCEFILEEVGQCSIDHANAYHEDLDVHFSSGVYNRAFYLLATSEDWNVKKAFDLMVQANRFYWTEESTFAQGACGVLKAARDYKYDKQKVMEVFSTVGVDTTQC